MATAHLGIARLSAFLVDEFRETWPEPDILFNTAEIRWRDEGLVRNKAVYVALALNIEGEKEVLGLWIEQTEGAKFWLNVMNELKTRGVADILIAVVDGLKGFPDAIGTVFPL